MSQLRTYLSLNYPLKACSIRLNVSALSRTLAEYLVLPPAPSGPAAARFLLDHLGTVALKNRITYLTYPVPLRYFTFKAQVSSAVILFIT